MKKYLTVFLFLLSISLAVSCAESEAKQNPVFEKSLPDSKTYKDELVRQLGKADKAKLSYYFDSYEEKDGKEYINVTIEGDDLKAHTSMRVKEWDETLQPLKEFKGKGYGGAELVNLKYEILQDAGATEFVYVRAEELND